MSAASDDRHLDYVYAPKSTTKQPVSAEKTANLITNLSDIVGSNFATALNNISTTAAEANRLSAASAYAATQASMAEAARNRQWQQDIYNQTSAYNAAEAQKNRDWQEQMSNTAYQRAVKDMRAAGINPILAYQQGGASTPSGTTASIGTLGGSTGNAYSYQALQHQNDSIEILGAVLTTSLGLISELVKAYNPDSSGNLKQIARAKIQKALESKYAPKGYSSAK